VRRVGRLADKGTIVAFFRGARESAFALGVLRGWKRRVRGLALSLLAVHVLQVVLVLPVVLALHVILAVRAVLVLLALLVLLVVKTLIHLPRLYPRDSCTRSTGHENELAREDPVFP
jgi:hypothetical protein